MSSSIHSQVHMPEKHIVKNIMAKSMAFYKSNLNSILRYRLGKKFTEQNGNAKSNILTADKQMMIE